MKLNRKMIRKMILKEMAEMQSDFSYSIDIIGQEFGETTVFLEMKVGQEDCDIAFQTPLHVTNEDLAYILEGGLGEELEHSHHIDATETSANANEFLTKYQALIAPHVKHIVFDILDLNLEQPSHLGFYPDEY